MCGIAGVISSKPGALKQAEEMGRALAHRGPDGCGVFSQRIGQGRTVALSHRRLAIVDLTDAGRQPMTSRDQRWTLVFNGEIFNYVALRGALETAGVHIATATDTEVLLEACAFWGVEQTLERAVGMFAFALWDSLTEELTLARDRVGEKPLVYYWDGSTLAFASEMKVLGEFHGGRLDPAAVDLYLALGYVPAPSGIFRNTAKLQAGHMACWKNGTLSVSRWWRPETVSAESQNGAAGSVEEKLRAEVAQSVRLRLRSDVPVALALSGGLDSSVVAAELAREKQRPDAFTVVFDDDPADLPYATTIARKYGLRHEVIHAEQRSVVDALECAIDHYDEPFADSSALASLALARALGGRYKVILNGDGGDEAFGGYRHYEFIGAKQFVKGAAAAAGLVDGDGPAGIYVQSKSTFRQIERDQLLNGHGEGDALSRLLRSDPFLGVPANGALKRALWSDRHLYLANDLTYKMDIALASGGMEGRAPFLDHRILEWAQGLPPTDLVRGREKKILLRRAYAGELPREILDRPKHGFGAPIASWLDGPLAQTVRRSLPHPLLDPSAQIGLSGQRLWTLLTFALWADRWGARW